MKRSVVAVMCLAIVCGLMPAGRGAPAKFNRKVNIGDSGPRFSDLAGIDDEAHSFDEYRAAQVLVLLFTCNHCPVATAYEDRFIEFQKKYKEKNVVLVAINVNTGPADRLEKMRERAARKGFNFDYLYDPSQQTARDYGATVTPQLFILDRDRKIAYMGAFDDNQDRSKVKSHYVTDAVDALLAGNQPEIRESRPFGCAIEYEQE